MPFLGAMPIYHRIEDNEPPSVKYFALSNGLAPDRCYAISWTTPLYC